MKLKKVMALTLTGAMVLLTGCGSSRAVETPEVQTTQAAAETSKVDVEAKGDTKTEAAGDVVSIDKDYNWTVAMNVSEETLNYKMMEKFQTLIEERSNGKVIVNLYANGQLGNDTEQMQGLIDGSNDFVTTITSGLTSFVKEYAVFDLPNVFPDLKTMRTVLGDNSFKDELNSYSGPKNIKLIGMADAGFREATTNKEIKTADDFKGLKIRVIQNPYHISYWQSLGANPLAMDFSEVYVGLQQKTIDAQENPYMKIVANKFYEVQDYVIETNHLGHIMVFLMRNDLYESLPEEVKALVDECAAEAVSYTNGLADESIASYKKTIEESGTQIITLDQAELDRMKEMSQGVYDQVRGEIGDGLVGTLLKSVEAAE